MSERPTCTIPKPSKIIPIARISPKIKSDRLLTTVRHEAEAHEPEEGSAGYLAHGERAVEVPFRERVEREPHQGNRAEHERIAQPRGPSEGAGAAYGTHARPAPVLAQASDPASS